MASSYSASRASGLLGSLVTLVVASLVIACTGATGASPSGSAAPSDSDTRPSGPVSIPPSPGTSPGAVPQALLDAILMDVAAVAGVETSEVTVVSTESVTWNDGSLGCPKPGVFYTQQIISGYRVVVEAGGERYDYRAGASGEPKLCEGSMPVGGSS